MNEAKIKIKLPAEMIIHIPAFSDLSLESCFKVASEAGVKAIEQKVKDLIAEEIVKRNTKKIKEMVSKKVSEIEEDILVKVVEALKK